MDQSPLRSKRCRRRGTRSGRAQLRQEVGSQTISLQARLIRGLRRMEQIRAQVYLVCAEATVYRRPCLQLDAQGPHVHCLAMPLFGPRLLGKCRSHGIQRDDACHSRTRPPARPIRCDAIVRWAPLFVSTLGQPPIERKAMPDAPGMDQPFASCSAQSCITRRQPRQPGSQIGTLE